MPANPFVAVVCCCVAFASSGFVAVQLADPDQGRVVTVADAQRMSVQQRERILNNPHIPPKAKEAILRSMRYPDRSGNALRQSRSADSD
jgi:hypothetical protein